MIAGRICRKCGKKFNPELTGDRVCAACRTRRNKQTKDRKQRLRPGKIAGLPFGAEWAPCPMICSSKSRLTSWPATTSPGRATKGKLTCGQSYSVWPFVLLIIFGLASIMLSSTISQAEEYEQNRES